MTKLTYDARIKYFTSQIASGASCGQLFGVCNKLLGKNKPLLLPSIYSILELPGRFLDFFENKIQTIRNSLSRQTLSFSSPVADRRFHGVPLSCFQTVSEETVKKVILSSTPTPCDPIPTPLLIECLPTLLPYITSAVNNSLCSGIFLVFFLLCSSQP